MNRGNAKAELKEYSEAIADYDKAIELDPKLAPAYYNRGITYRELGKEEEAKKDFKKAQELDPTLIFQEEAKKAKKEVREEIKEEIKETAAETQKTQDFQKILEDLKEKFRKTTNRLKSYPIGTVVVLKYYSNFSQIFCKLSKNIQLIAFIILDSFELLF